MPKINKEILSWLTTVPASDINFRSRLKDANWITIHEALKDKFISKAARNFMEAQLKRLEKLNGN